MNKQEVKILSKAVFGREVDSFDPSKNLHLLKYLFKWMKLNRIYFEADTGGNTCKPFVLSNYTKGERFVTYHTTARTLELAICRMCVNRIKDYDGKLKTIPLPKQRNKTGVDVIYSAYLSRRLND